MRAMEFFLAKYPIHHDATTTSMLYSWEVDVLIIKILFLVLSTFSIIRIKQHNFETLKWGFVVSARLVMSSCMYLMPRSPTTGPLLSPCSLDALQIKLHSSMDFISDLCISLKHTSPCGPSTFNFLHLRLVVQSAAWKLIPMRKQTCAGELALELDFYMALQTKMPQVPTYYPEINRFNINKYLYRLNKLQFNHCEINHISNVSKSFVCTLSDVYSSQAWFYIWICYTNLNIPIKTTYTVND